MNNLIILLNGFSSSFLSFSETLKPLYRISPEERTKLLVVCLTLAKIITHFILFCASKGVIMKHNCVLY